MDLLKLMLVRTSNNFWEDCIPPESVMDDIPYSRSEGTKYFYDCFTVFNRQAVHS